MYVLAVTDGWIFLQRVAQCRDLLSHGLHHFGLLVLVHPGGAVERVQRSGIIQRKHLQEQRDI